MELSKSSKLGWMALLCGVVILYAGYSYFQTLPGPIPDEE